MTNEETEALFQKVIEKNMASNRRCSCCRYYVKEYKDKYTLETREACSFAQTYGYVSHNPARLCRYYQAR